MRGVIATPDLQGTTVRPRHAQVTATPDWVMAFAPTVTALAIQNGPDFLVKLRSALSSVTAMVFVTR